MKSIVFVLCLLAAHSATASRTILQSNLVDESSGAAPVPTSLSSPSEAPDSGVRLSGTVDLSTHGRLTALLNTATVSTSTESGVPVKVLSFAATTTSSGTSTNKTTTGSTGGTTGTGSGSTGGTTGTGSGTTTSSGSTLSVDPVVAICLPYALIEGENSPDVTTCLETFIDATGPSSIPSTCYNLLAKMTTKSTKTDVQNYESCLAKNGYACPSCSTSGSGGSTTTNGSTTNGGTKTSGNMGSTTSSNNNNYDYTDYASGPSLVSGIGR